MGSYRGRLKLLVYLSAYLWLVAVVPSCGGKVVRGIASSLSAWHGRGQFITKFCFHDKRALFKFSTNSSSEGRLLFYLDEAWPYAYAETDCDKKIAMAKFSCNLSNTSGEEYVSQWIRPHFWFVVYADEHTCNASKPPYVEGVTFEMTFLNPDLAGDATDHFGDDFRGLQTFYCLLMIFYLAGVGLYAHRVYLTISKGGPMHEVLLMLSIAMALHFWSAFFMLVHLWRYSSNGEGLPTLEANSEALEVLSQCLMVWMLLSMSMGWTLGSSTIHPFREKGQLYSHLSLAAVHIFLVLWEQWYDESHYTYHVHESFPGLLLVLLRLFLTALFGYNLRITMASERSSLRKNFYQSFSVGCFLWFFSFPFLMVVAMIFPPYWRHKVVTVGVTLVQTSSMAWLSRLFLSRSLYWEVSTLSSTTLPLRLDRGGGGKMQGYFSKRK